MFSRLYRYIIGLQFTFLYQCSLPSSLLCNFRNSKLKNFVSYICGNNVCILLLNSLYESKTHTNLNYMIYQLLLICIHLIPGSGL